MFAAAGLLALATPAGAGTLLDQPDPHPAATMMHAADMPADAPTDPFNAATSSYHGSAGWIRTPDRHDVAVFLDAFLKGAGLLAIVYALIHGHALLGRRSSRR